jgi:predicted hydrocarbon binding protein
MHGLIFAQLKKYVDGRLGASAWESLLSKAGLAGKLYMPVSTYPDAEVVALVAAASASTGLEPDAILQDFGEFIAPDLLRMYGSLLPKEWRTLDILEHTEETIHRVVRTQNRGADPPHLVAKRSSETEVVINYTSARRMCGIAKGIVRGIAAQRGESITLSETTCMLRGGTRCELVVRLGVSSPRGSA